MSGPERDSIDDRLQKIGAYDLGGEPDPEAVEQVLRRWTASLEGVDPLRRRMERNALADLQGIRAADVDTALASQPSAESQEGDSPDPRRLRELGRPVLEAETQLDRLQAKLRDLGYAGPTEPAELVHLALVSRLLDRPLGVTLVGPSASGKTFTVETVMRFHPEDVVHDLTAMSERALAYSDFSTEHRYVHISEASALHRDGAGATIIRGLAWGDGIRYETVEKTGDGLKSRVIEKAGPTGLITTTTGDLDDEIATRLLTITLTDSPDQTRNVVEELALEAAGRQPEKPCLESWKAASRYLEFAGDREVLVPYAPEIAQQIPGEAVRMRRDFSQLLTVIKAHALTHQLQRERSHSGQILAERADYEAAYRLLKSVLGETLDDVSEQARETVAAVKELNEEPGPEGTSYGDLADKLGLSRSGAHRRAEKLIESGYLANVEDRPGYSAQIVTQEPLPEKRSVLPQPSDIVFSESPNSAQRLKADGQGRDGTGLLRLQPGAAGGSGVEAKENQGSPQSKSELNGNTSGADTDYLDSVEDLSTAREDLIQDSTEVCRKCGSGGVPGDQKLCTYCRRAENQA